MLSQQPPSQECSCTNNQVDDFTPFRHNFTGDWKNFPGSWFTKQPGGCYDKTNLDNATCRLPMGCAKSRDWLPASVKVFARSDVLLAWG